MFYMPTQSAIAAEQGGCFMPLLREHQPAPCELVVRAAVAASLPSFWGRRCWWCFWAVQIAYSSHAHDATMGGLQETADDARYCVHGAGCPELRWHRRRPWSCADTILLFQCGEFYEMFHADAILASGVLGITLTRRQSRGATAEIPMCGVPIFASATHIARLVRAGHKVALCDQVEVSMPLVPCFCFSA